MKRAKRALSRKILSAIDDEKTTQGVIDLLIKALADEWLAAYQYWICKNLSNGEGKLESDDEFDQHYEEEVHHADELAERITELGGRPITNPAQWETYANPWTEVNTTSVKEMLVVTIQAEEEAIKYYSDVLDYVRDFDEKTYKIIEHILEEEMEHLDDLNEIQNILE